MNDALRTARLEAQLLSANLKLEQEKAITDYNVMMGNLEDPSEEEDTNE